MAPRLPIGPDDDRLDVEAVDQTRRFLTVEAFADLLSISPRTAWRLVVARDPRIEVVRLGAGPRPIVRVRLRDFGVGGNT